MIYHALRHHEKNCLQDYYSRTMRSLATQVSLGYKLGYRPNHGVHIQARQKAFPNHDHEHGLDREIRD